MSYFDICQGQTDHVPLIVRRGLVWAGAGAGPAAETLGAWGSLTASEEEDSAQTR